MSRLIDADLLKENISRWLKPSAPDETEMIEVADALVSTMIEIEEQPTAFDVDKVMEQLENRSALARPVGWSKAYEIIILKDAIEIVKGGGVE
jgi:hypothetical protein|nr:MAG TPA: hypothetical protein [Caudoviricetes sp.]